MPRRQKTGDRRIDAAIDHFVPMGFKKVDIRNIVNSLLKNVYGNDGWPFLEENCYHVVQEALLEKQEEEEKLQLQVLQKKQQQQEEEEQQQQDDDEEAQHVQEQQQEEWEDEDVDQQQDAAMVPVVQVHNEEPSNTVLAVEQTEEVIIDPPAPKALPHLAATRSGRTRRPCFGWISESDSDSDYEEFLASRQQVVHVPTAGGDLGKRKRLTRWDVKKEAT
ncbi:hypothetical protein QYE76_066385 [Lolium multiflorum]|uniref:WIYLD domain-containing protein n=1 Tax=Lolium multiflorum TaxID=4521 RepID=A0AAD8SAX3_LOLMU|nr:hypothetical protein QYE76_066385 [Lolium multiflorum]